MWLLSKLYYVKFGVSSLFFSKVNLRKTLGGGGRVGSPLVKEGLRSMVLGYLSDSQIVLIEPPSEPIQ